MTTVIFEKEEVEADPGMRRLKPIDFWVRHLTLILGLIGLAYMLGQTHAALKLIKLDDLHESIELYSAIAYSFLAAYFGVHYFYSLLCRAADVGVPILPVIVWIVVCFATAVFFAVQARMGGFDLSQPAMLLYLLPFVPLYILVMLPTATFGGYNSDTAFSMEATE
ncbi:MAG: hypothetical protein AAGJ34_08465 [Pseudomonadota bacterium]